MGDKEAVVGTILDEAAAELVDPEVEAVELLELGVALLVIADDTLLDPDIETVGLLKLEPKVTAELRPDDATELDVFEDAVLLELKLKILLVEIEREDCIDEVDRIEVELSPDDIPMLLAPEVDCRVDVGIELEVLIIKLELEEVNVLRMVLEEDPALFEEALLVAELPTLPGVETPPWDDATLVLPVAIGGEIEELVVEEGIKTTGVVELGIPTVGVAENNTLVVATAKTVTVVGAVTRNCFGCKLTAGYKLPKFVMLAPFSILNRSSYVPAVNLLSILPGQSTLVYAVDPPRTLHSLDCWFPPS